MLVHATLVLFTWADIQTFAIAVVSREQHSQQSVVLPFLDLTLEKSILTQTM